MRKFVVVVLMLLVASANVQAENILLATGEWVPYTSQKMEGHGFISEIISEVIREMKLTPRYEFYKWDRCYSLVIRGKVWAAFPYSHTEERAKEVLFSNSVGESTTKFFCFGKGKDFPYDKLTDLKPYKIGGVKGYFYEEAFKKAGLNVSYTSDETSALRRLAAGRVELIPMNELVGWELIKKVFPDKIGQFRTLDRAYDRDELKLIVSKKYPDSEKLLESFNNALKAVKGTARHKAILKKYGLNTEQ